VINEQTRDLETVARAFGATLGRASRAPWGDADATWHLWLETGRRVVARRFDRRSTGEAERLATVMRQSADAGLPVPRARVVTTRNATWLVTAHVEGATGAAWLDTDDRARVIAATMGHLRRRLRDLEAEGLFAADDAVRDGRAGHLAGSTFVHGDFAPINVIVDGTGRILALLDFEHVRLGHPLEDVAWWGWVVRHHHPAAWAAAWPTFAKVAGVDVEADGPAIRALMLRELERRATIATEEADRARWRSRLDEAASW